MMNNIEQLYDKGGAISPPFCAGRRAQHDAHGCDESSEYVRVCQSEVNGFVNAMALRPHLDVVAVNIDVTTMETAADIPGQKNHAKRESCPKPQINNIQQQFIAKAMIASTCGIPHPASNGDPTGSHGLSSLAEGEWEKAIQRNESPGPTGSAIPASHGILELVGDFAGNPHVTWE